jgi:hypothetical protein
VKTARRRLGLSIAAAQKTCPNLEGTSMWRVFLVASGLVLLLFASSHASSFDGAWSVVQVCDSTDDGSRRYTWRYDATVKNGHLIGQYRLKGQRPSLTLTGKIEPDGSATLTAEGLSANPDYNVWSAAQGRISLRVTANFDATLGSGRAGVRGCRFAFNKH